MGVTNRGRIAVLGGGPAGLTAADAIARRGQSGVVFEADVQVGGIARTVERDGYRFDLGGHRFFTKVPEVQQMWEDVLGEEFLVRRRLSRIYFGGKFFAYPLRAEDVVRRLGVVETARCIGSYLAARLRRGKPVDSFEDWVTDRFGKRLYNAFFRSYTEKVWGIPGDQIQSEWAAQRIKNLSFWTALTSALRLNRTHVTSLIEEFHYPRLGPGQMWETLARRIEDAGIPVRLEHRCRTLRRDEYTITSVVVESAEGVEEHPVDGVISTIALSDMILSLDPPPPPHIVSAAERLRYRDLVLVAVMTEQPEPFPDNWIYLHDPGIRAGRVQNFGAWSPDMTRPGTTCLGAEYFCFRGDEIWTMPDAEAIELATRELASIGLVDPDKVIGGAKVLVPKAYPMYDRGYDALVDVLRRYVERFVNLQTCGRNGLHRYNNQDHSMVTAMLAVANLVDGASHDVWSVNSEDVYLEQIVPDDAELAVSLSTSVRGVETLVVDDSFELTA